MRACVALVALLALLGAAAASEAGLGDNGLTTYTGRKRSPSTLVFGNDMVAEQGAQAVMSAAKDIMKGTWRPFQNEAATEKAEVHLECLNSVAPAPLNWKMWCPGTDAKVVGWQDKSGAAHRQITLRPQRGMTSTMYQWFITTTVMGFMPPIVEFEGNYYHYYHLWHPLDHVESAWKMGPKMPVLQKGPTVYVLIHERYRNPPSFPYNRHYETNGWFWVEDSVVNLMKNRYVITMPLMGLPTWTMILEFNDTPEGLVVDVEVIAGIPHKGFDDRAPHDGYKMAAGINELFTAPLLAKQKGSFDWEESINAITRHVIEEFSNLQHFVPYLYEKCTLLGKAGINWMPTLGTWLQIHHKEVADSSSVSFYHTLEKLAEKQISKNNTLTGHLADLQFSIWNKTFLAGAKLVTVTSEQVARKTWVPIHNTLTKRAHKRNKAHGAHREVGITLHSIRNGVISKLLEGAEITTETYIVGGGIPPRPANRTTAPPRDSEESQAGRQEAQDGEGAAEGGERQTQRTKHNEDGRGEQTKQRRGKNVDSGQQQPAVDGGKPKAKPPPGVDKPAQQQAPAPVKQGRRERQAAAPPPAPAQASSKAGGDGDNEEDGEGGKAGSDGGNVQGRGTGADAGPDGDDGDDSDGGDDDDGGSGGNGSGKAGGSSGARPDVRQESKPGANPGERPDQPEKLTPSANSGGPASTPAAPATGSDDGSEDGDGDGDAGGDDDGEGADAGAGGSADGAGDDNGGGDDGGDDGDGDDGADGAGSSANKAVEDNPAVALREQMKMDNAEPERDLRDDEDDEDEDDGAEDDDEEDDEPLFDGEELKLENGAVTGTVAPSDAAAMQLPQLPVKPKKLKKGVLTGLVDGSARAEPAVVAEVPSVSLGNISATIRRYSKQQLGSTGNSKQLQGMGDSGNGKAAQPGAKATAGTKKTAQASSSTVQQQFLAAAKAKHDNKTIQLAVLLQKMNLTTLLGPSNSSNMMAPSGTAVNASRAQAGTAAKVDNVLSPLAQVLAGAAAAQQAAVKTTGQSKPRVRKGLFAGLQQLARPPMIKAPIIKPPVIKAPKLPESILQLQPGRAEAHGNTITFTSPSFSFKFKPPKSAR